MKRYAAALAVLTAVLVPAAPAKNPCEVVADIRQDDPYAPLVVGDSVTFAATKQLARHGFAVQARPCRTYSQGIDEVLARRSLPDHVVIALGSNDTVSAAQIRETLELVGPFGRVTFVLPRALGGGPDPDGKVMRSAENAYPEQVATLDWPAHSEPHGDWLAPDGLHLTTAGAQGFADFIAEAASFEPLEPIEPPAKEEPSEPRRPAPAAPKGDPAVAAFWRTLGAAAGTVFAPAVRLLGRLIDFDAATSPDL